MSRYRVLAIVTAVSLVLDQATKLYVDANFELYESIPVIEGWFHLTYIRNKGAAFGILSSGALRIPFFIGVAVIALAAILWYLRSLRAATARGPTRRWCGRSSATSRTSR